MSGRVKPYTSRDDRQNPLAVSVGALGGARATGHLVERSAFAIHDYVAGRRTPSPRIIALIAEATTALSAELAANAVKLRSMTTATEEKLARRRLAARERYYARFGRYPVPARGNKTP